MPEPAKKNPIRFKLHSIQTKLTFSIIFILIPVIALLSILSFRNAKTLLSDRIVDQLESLATTKQEQIQELFVKNTTALESLATREDIITVLRGQQTAAALGKTIQVLETLVSQNSDIERILVTDPQGTIIAASDQKENPETKAFERHAVSAKTKVAIEKDDGNVFISSPIRSDETILGFTIVKLKSSLLEDIVTDYSGLGRSGRVILARREGEAIVYLNAPRNEENPARRENIKDNLRSPIVLATQKLSGLAETTDPEGNPVIAVYRYLPATDWGLVVDINTKEAFAPIETLKRELIQVSFLILFLFILVAFIVSRSITEPLHKLHIGTEKIGKGEWDYELNIKTGDEVEQLATEFTKMAKHLKETYLGLEEKVKERTAELEKTKDEIEQEKVKDETILTSIGDGVFVTDTEGKIIFFNRAASEFTGSTSQEAIGRNFYEVVGIKKDGEKSIPNEETPAAQALRDGKTTRTDRLFYTHKSGRVYPVALVATPLVIDGKTLGAIIVFRDITREKEVDRMKTEFISVASHQLRTPLSAIKWFTEMLIAGDAGELNQEQKEFLGQVYTSNDRMIELVNSLLNVSRIEQGRITIEPQPTDLVELVNQVLTELTPKIKEKNLQVVVSKHEKLPKISIDPKLIRQVYANLLSNAVKYTPNGGEITVFISHKGEDVISQVRDTGYGIPSDQQKKVFTKFFRGDNIRSVSTEGTGLGLYIVKSIVESSGGRIWFESKEGKGTTFWFTLPVAGTPPRKGERTLEATKL